MCPVSSRFRLVSPLLFSGFDATYLVLGAGLLTFSTALQCYGLLQNRLNSSLQSLHSAFPSPPPFPPASLFLCTRSYPRRANGLWCGLSGCAPCPCPRPSGRSANPTAPLDSFPCTFPPSPKRKKKRESKLDASPSCIHSPVTYRRRLCYSFPSGSAHEIT